jgi:hypothetical protein
MKHKMHMMHEGMSKGRHGSRGMYENEVEMPHVPPHGKNEPMCNLHDFKDEAMDTAYGQAGQMGCKSDEKKIHSQFKSYGWDANTGY